MPVRRRVSALQDVTVDPWVFTYGDGTWCWWKAPVYATREAAARAWRYARREAWAQNFRMDVPQAAIEYDGLTRDAWELVWSAWRHESFPIEDALAAIDADRRAVDTFEERDPKGARSIADFLAAWRADLDTLEAVARALAVDPWCGAHRRMSVAERYGHR